MARLLMIVDVDLDEAREDPGEVAADVVFDPALDCVSLRRYGEVSPKVESARWLSPPTKTELEWARNTAADLLTFVIGRTDHEAVTRMMDGFDTEQAVTILAYVLGLFGRVLDEGKALGMIKPNEFLVRIRKAGGSA